MTDHLTAFQRNLARRLRAGGQGERRPGRLPGMAGPPAGPRRHQAVQSRLGPALRKGDRLAQGSLVARGDHESTAP